MATVADLIRLAFKTLGVLAGDETPSAGEQSDALTTLNDMLDSWAGERLVLFATLRSTYTLTQGLNPHTIGTGGTFDTTRPVQVERASLILGTNPGVEQPISIVSDAEWQNSFDKTSPGKPRILWVESSYPLGKLWLLPVPDATDSLVLYTPQQLGRFAATSTSFDLPPGYGRAIRYNLAKELAPEYGLALSGEAAFIADESKATLKRNNHKPSYLRSDPALVRPRFNIVAGTSSGGSDNGGLY